MKLIDNALLRLSLSKGEELAFYILRHTNGDTKIFSRSYAQMQKDLGISQATIAHAFKEMEKNGGIIRAGVGKWFIPAVVGYQPESEENWGILAADEE